MSSRLLESSDELAAPDDRYVQGHRAIVQREIARAGNKEPEAYRVVAPKAGLGYDYVYQIYKGKPKDRPKQPSMEVMSSLARAYADDPAIWPLVQPWASASTIPPEDAPPAADTKGRALHRVSDSQWALLQMFSELPEAEQNELLTSIKQRVEEVRRIVNDYLRKNHGVTGTAPSERVAAALPLSPDRRKQAASPHAPRQVTNHNPTDDEKP